MGVICLISYYLYYPTNPVESVFFSLTSGILICIAVIDYKYFIIPLSLLLLSITLNVPYIFMFSEPMFHLYGILIGLGYLSIIFIFTWIVTKKQPLGFGDLQLIILLGMWLGTLKILLTIFLGSLLGITYWIILLSIKGYSKNIKLPFGTFLCIAAIIIYLIPLNWNFF